MKHWLLGLLGLLGLLVGFAAPAVAQYRPQGVVDGGNGGESTLPWFSLYNFNTTGIGYDVQQTPTYRLSALTGTRSCDDYNDYSQNGCIQADLASYPAMRDVGTIMVPDNLFAKTRRFLHPGIAFDRAHSPNFDCRETATCLEAERSYGPEAKVGRCTQTTQAISASPVMLLDVDQQYSHPIDIGLKTGISGVLDLVVRAPDGSWLCNESGNGFLSV